MSPEIGNRDPEPWPPLRAALPLVVVACLFLGAARLATGFEDGPPPAVSGGFGEPSCHHCHFDNPVNAEGGRLSVEGVPPAYEPGRRYEIVVALERAGMRRGGFQLTARVAEGQGKGRQAGSFRAPDSRVAVLHDSGQQLDYVQHTHEGSEVASEGASRWTVEWTSPAAPGPVVFHVAGNAGNGDRSEFGDFVYTRELASSRIP